MTVGHGPDPDWDVFISYTQADRAWAEWIAWELEEAGHGVLVQAWDFVAGSNWAYRMQEAASRAERTIAVLSDAYLASKFGAAEWLTAWTSDPLGEGRHLLTVRVGDCARAGFLSQVVGIDVFGCPEPTARARLQRMMAGARDGRAKPSTKPAFPGNGRAASRRPHFPGDLPKVWRVPARNVNFAGRLDELGRVEAGFKTASTVTVHSLHGMGGVGKTQLATEYAC